MKLAQMVEALKVEMVHRAPTFEDAEVENVIASDLMSDVLVVDKSRLLLVTSLASDQAVRTADIVGAVGVLVVNGKTLPGPMKTLAAELGMTLMRAPFSKYEACVRLGTLLEPHA